MRAWVALVLTGLAAPALGESRQRPPQSCRITNAAEHTVVAVLDGRTMALNDGRTIRLTGLIIPQFAEQQARAALEDLVSRHQVAVAPAPEPDRYGRLQAFVSTKRDGTARLVQGALLRQGDAVLLPATTADCIAELRDSERLAREQKLGLWADPYYLVKQAGEPKKLLVERGRFAIAEGKVVSVRESGGMIYLNFARRWTDALTVGVLKRNEPVFTAAGLVLKRLEGSVIRIRGWVEARSGPWIEATRPEQIEVVSPR